MRALAEAGWRVRILARRDPVDPCWAGLEPQVVLGDLSDDRALAALCRGADAVIHGAALVKARSAGEFAAVNREGARRLAEAAHHVGNVVLVSSLAAREPQLSHYAASKRGAEDAVSAVLGPRLTVARPPAIYGPGDRELLPVFQAADSLPILPVLSETARVGMIHVEDAARQIAALAARPAGRPVALSDSRPDGYLWRELMAEAARACGRSPRLAPMPKALVRLVGITNDFRAVLGANPMLTSGKARELLHSDWSIAPLERVAGLPEPIHTLSDGFAETVRWYRAASWMKH